MTQDGASLLRVLIDRAHAEPFNAIATAIFALAIVHTFFAARILAWSKVAQDRHDARSRASHTPSAPSVLAETLHFFGEVEVIFGLWAVVLLVAMTGYSGWAAAKHYFNDTVNYTEPLFVVVIMAMAAARPVVMLAESAVRQLARLGGGSAAAWWVAILVAGPLLGSLITEPAAMTICALLLGRQFYARGPSTRLKYATLGLLFVKRVDWRHADVVRGAARADRGARLVVGFAVHADAFRLACRHGRHGEHGRVPRAVQEGTAIAGCGATRGGRSAGVIQRRVGSLAPADVDHAGRISRSWRLSSSPAMNPRCSSDRSCSSSDSRARPRRIRM
jgi:hypothetical protein